MKMTTTSFTWTSGLARRIAARAYTRRYSMMMIMMGYTCVTVFVGVWTLFGL